MQKMKKINPPYSVAEALDFRAWNEIPKPVMWEFKESQSKWKHVIELIQLSYYK